MALRPWEELPDYMRNPEVRPYYEKLKKHQSSLILKRIFDFIVSFIMLMILWPFQERVTTYGKRFKIWKFQTMVTGAEKKGSAVTVKGDSRITRIGIFLRNTRLDELPQLVNILTGDMSFVGTRPEVVKYVEKYRPEYYATLLLPAGVTSEASIHYKDEYKLLADADDVDRVYIEKVLPDKMKWNLESIRRFYFLSDIITMFRTVLAILGKDYN